MPRYEYYKKKVNKKKIIRDIILIYVIAVLFVLFFNSFIMQAYKVPSNSMFPTISEGDRVLANKFIYGPKLPFTDIRIFNATKNIKRGDVIIFLSKEYYNTNHLFRSLSSLIYTLTFSLVDISSFLKNYDANMYIKRVIGIPGDRIKFEINNNKVIILINEINEKKVINLNYKVIEETEENSPLISSMIIQNEIILKENQYYVIGDNRAVSADSRIWGPIDSNQIIGKAVLKYWPISSFGFINKYK
ncbi:MAG TPA: signal peptidase I [Spirochaetota bacterium]|nr:signal peptidase I [Spirochaetota bacterium]HOL56119.1 signal peptidase I [Spirochaetota bacterium]HPP04066.1 signal peptidase I [Spirochaetota bacterium]